MERAKLHSGRLCDQPASARQDSGTQVFEGGGVPGRAGPCEGPAPPGAPTRCHCRAPHPALSSNAAIDDALDRARRGVRTGYRGRHKNNSNYGVRSLGKETERVMDSMLDRRQ